MCGAPTKKAKINKQLSNKRISSPDASNNSLAEKSAQPDVPHNISAENLELNLERWIQSEGPHKWVEARSGHWKQSEYSALVNWLKKSTFWPLDLIQVEKLIKSLNAKRFPSKIDQKCREGRRENKENRDASHFLENEASSIERTVPKKSISFWRKILKWFARDDPEARFDAFLERLKSPKESSQSRIDTVASVYQVPAEAIRERIYSEYNDLFIELSVSALQGNPTASPEDICAPVFEQAANRIAKKYGLSPATMMSIIEEGQKDYEELDVDGLN